ncbi:MAG TPA: mechanosensitive ion channel domain-containing protein [Polyangiaceae bacterium]|nr:mechanosensitive ion channel domain-containing protein [Polyangiaceae bacterium]
MNPNPLHHVTERIDFGLFEVGGRTITLGTLIASALTLAFAYLLSYLLRRGIDRALSGTADSGAVHAITRLLHYGIVLIGFSVALQTAGIDLRGLFAAGALFAVGIGFAMQNVAQNFVSGIILLVEHSIRPGDVLDIEGKQVRVVEMGVRSTRVRSRDDEVLIVPNSTLVQATVRSYTLLDTLCRVRVLVGVAYDMDQRAVRKVIEETARDLPFRSRAKDPLVLLNELGESAVEWEVSVWIEDPWLLRPHGAAVREALFHALHDHGIRMAFPQVDLHLDAPVVAALSQRAA